jgi:GH43 family beta-xylosidase
VKVAATFRNPVIMGEPGTDHGDPFIIKYLDTFYLYHSGETSGRRGIAVHRSVDLVHWEDAGYAVEPADEGWAWSDLWAPEVVYERGTFYMYFSATRRRTDGEAGGMWAPNAAGAEEGRRLGVARAQSPLGPFAIDTQPLLDQWSIDGHPFRDDDGTMWLFYNVRTRDLALPGVLPGTGTVCDRLVAADRLAGNPTPVTLPSHAWEGVPTLDWSWNEAPYVLKRRGWYHQMYSGGAFADRSYAIGSARSSSLTGVWEKDPENPIVRGEGRIVGPGHHSFVYGPDVATQYAVYHAYVEGEEGRKVLLDRFLWAGDRPFVAGPTDGLQPAPPPAVFEPDIPHWRAEAWVRGSWVEVSGMRFALVPRHVWHQVEVVHAHQRSTVRIGGVLRASSPAPTSAPDFGSDGDITSVTVSSYLEDAERHDLPAGSTYSWDWGGSGPLELALAVKGTADVEIDGASHHVQGRDRFRLVRVEHADGARRISVHAGDAGVAIADLAVYARG